MLTEKVLLAIEKFQKLASSADLNTLDTAKLIASFKDGTVKKPMDKLTTEWTRVNRSLHSML